MQIESETLEKITFYDTKTNEADDLYVIEETVLRGIKYLLVAEEDADESNSYIFKEIKEDDDNKIYEPVVDDDEYEALVKVFEQLLIDTDIISG